MLTCCTFLWTSRTQAWTVQRHCPIPCHRMDLLSQATPADTLAAVTRSEAAGKRRLRDRWVSRFDLLHIVVDALDARMDCAVVDQIVSVTPAACSALTSCILMQLSSH